MAVFQPSSSTPRSGKSPQVRSLHNSLSLSRSGLDDTLHSTQSLSGRSSIMTHNNKQYPSASAALAAYISDFENANPLSQTYHRTVEDLLTPRSVLLRTVDRSLETGVRDTKAEWHHYTSKKLLDESFSEMVRADVEREKVESLMEASRLLTADLSPLPGSSVITEIESGASISTDALLHAPLYPTLKQPPSRIPEESVPEWNPIFSKESLPENGNVRREFEHRIGRYSQGSQTQSLRGKMCNSTARSRVASDNRPPRMYSSQAHKFQSNVLPEKLVLGIADEFSQSVQKLGYTQPSLQRRNFQSGKILQRGESEGRVASKRFADLTSVSNLGMPQHFDHRLKRNSRSSNEKAAVAQTSKTNGGRPPPSWIQDLDATGVSTITSQPLLGGRAPPSWIQDLDKTVMSGLTADAHTGGRAPPSWVQDLEVSGISSAFRSKTPEQGDGGRPPPSWIQDFNSTITSGKHSDIRNSKGYERTLSTSHTLKHKPTLRQSNSASDLLSETHDGTRLSDHPPGLSFKDFNSSETFLRDVGSKRYQGDMASLRGNLDSKRTLEFGMKSRPKKASSFTTDDLIMASPTGKDLHLLSHNSRGQYLSHRTPSNNFSSQLNSEHYAVNGAGFMDNHLPTNSRKMTSFQKHPRFSSHQTETSQRDHFSSTRGPSNLKMSSKRGGTSTLLASTPKCTVNFELTPARRSLNGYSEEEQLRLQSSSRSLHSQTRQKKRILEEDDRQREDALLQRAQKVLDDARASQCKPSLSRHNHGNNTDRHDDSLLTEEVLDGDRPWERNLPSLKPLKYDADEEDNHHRHPDIVAKFLEDCLRSVDENQKLTGGLQPGPVEALKNMLFTLQGLAPNSQPSPAKDAPVSPEKETLSSIRSSPSSSSLSGSKDTSTEKKYVDRGTVSSSGSGTDFDQAPGGKSLQRAMEHLTRLKFLVNGGSHPNSQPSSANAQVMSTS